MKSFFYIIVIASLSGCLFQGKGCSKKVTSVADIFPEMRFQPPAYSQFSAGFQKRMPINRYARCIRWYGRQKNSDFYRFFYTSQGERVSAILGQPRDLEKKHPIIVVSRSGYSDIGAVNVCDLRTTYSPFIRKGFIVVASQLKGNDGGTGKSDLGDGDVEDLRSMINIVLTLPYADRKNIFFIGEGKGGIIAMRAAAKGLNVNAISTIGTPFDLNTYQKANPERADRQFSRVIPGYPDGLEKKLNERSVKSFVGKILSPVLVFHGEKDDVVNVSEGKELYESLKQTNAKTKFVELKEIGRRYGKVRGEMIQEMLAYFEDFTKP